MEEKLYVIIKNTDSAGDKTHCFDVGQTVVSTDKESYTLKTCYGLRNRFGGRKTISQILANKEIILIGEL